MIERREKDKENTIRDLVTEEPYNILTSEISGFLEPRDILNLAFSSVFLQNAIWRKARISIREMMPFVFEYEEDVTKEHFWSISNFLCLVHDRRQKGFISRHEVYDGITTVYEEKASRVADFPILEKILNEFNTGPAIIRGSRYLSRNLDACVLLAAEGVDIPSASPSMPCFRLNAMAVSKSDNDISIIRYNITFPKGTDNEVRLASLLHGQDTYRFDGAGVLVKRGNQQDYISIFGTPKKTCPLWNLSFSVANKTIDKLQYIYFKNVGFSFLPYS